MTDSRTVPTATRRSALRMLGAGIALATPFVSRSARGAAFPGAIWPGGTPASVGLNVAKLVEAQRFAQRYGGGAGCVIRHGKLVHVWGSLTQRYQVHSSAKTWGSVRLSNRCCGHVCLGSFQVAWVFIMALRVTSILRMRAAMASLGGLPLAVSWA